MPCRWLGGVEKGGAAGMSRESVYKSDMRTLSYLSFISAQMTEPVTGSDLGNCRECRCSYFHLHDTRHPKLLRRLLNYIF